MSKFMIGPHMRLQEWVAEEKGYFKDEGLDYEFVTSTGFSKLSVKSATELPKDQIKGAYQSIEAGRTCDISSACHWTDQHGCCRRSRPAMGGSLLYAAVRDHGSAGFENQDGRRPRQCPDHASATSPEATTRRFRRWSRF